MCRGQITKGLDRALGVTLQAPSPLLSPTAPQTHVAHWRYRLRPASLGTWASLEKSSHDCFSFNLWNYFLLLLLFPKFRTPYTADPGPYFSLCVLSGDFI